MSAHSKKKLKLAGQTNVIFSQTCAFRSWLYTTGKKSLKFVDNHLKFLHGNSMAKRLIVVLTCPRIRCCNILVRGLSV
jgi:hypothetical protein